MRNQTILKTLVLILCMAVLIFVMVKTTDSREPLDYNAHLDDVALTVDSDEVTFSDLAFYILYEEGKVEKQARIYNPDYTKDYWNLHTNDTFIQLEAKDVVMEMAIHDHLFYQLAVEEGMDYLNDDEAEALNFRTTDFWEDLLDEQWEKLPCDKETINDQIRMVAIAEKYQSYLAKEKGPSLAAYNYDGYYYSLMLEEHQIDINDKLWDKLVMGDITLTHSKLNYINGLTDEDKKKSEE